MADRENRGKQFEKQIELAFARVRNPMAHVLRLYDSTSGFVGIKTPCDYVVYRCPYYYMVECKSVHGNTLPKNNISDFQMMSMLSASRIKGIYAGLYVWYIDHDETYYIPIETAYDWLNTQDYKSINIKDIWAKHIPGVLPVKGTKRRILFDYDMSDLLLNLRGDVNAL